MVWKHYGGTYGDTWPVGVYVRTLQDRADTSRRETPCGRAPSVLSWISTFPSAVASTGPATTGRLHACAVNAHSRLFCAPRP